MNKAELHDLAELGARRKVASIEQQLDALQREFPDIFVTSERPVFLKAELRHESDNGYHRQPKSAAKSAAVIASWTPARRAKAAKRMKAQQKKLQAVRKKMGLKKARTTSTNTRERNWKQHWYDRLKEKGEEQVGVSAKALGTTSASLLTSSRYWLKSGIIKKLKLGRYTIGPKEPE